MAAVNATAVAVKVDAPVVVAQAQPVVAAAVPVQGAKVVTGGNVNQAVDLTAFANLANWNSFTLKQRAWEMEAMTCGLKANGYEVCGVDPNVNGGQPVPIFRVKEESDCCTRWCCGPRHPFLLHVFNSRATGNIIHPPKCCGMGAPDYPEVVTDGAPVMTLERDGLCNKCPNCWVCHECCQDEMHVHAGNIHGVPGALDKSTAFGRNIVPMGGGGCTPTVNIMDRTDPSEEKVAAVVQGPTFFGGCLDLATDTSFGISRNGDGSADVGVMTKQKPEGCEGMCRAIFSDADSYKLDLTDKNLTPQQKAQLIANILHLDYMFFEQDNNFIRVEKQGDSWVLYINCCSCYCYGCVCPCELCIPLNSSN